jgi:hypothetical protein
MSRSRKPRSLFAALAAAIALMAVMIAPSSAITHGELDGNMHPHVGLMVASDAAGNPLWRCSGTLLSPTVYLTAGHCTEAPAAHVEVWFDSDEVTIRSKAYPFGGGANSVGGTPYTHPGYDPNFFVYRDVGVVVLESPVSAPTYGALPALNSLDGLATRRGKQEVWFTAVGYGLQRINPVFVEQDLDRRVAYPKLNQINVPGFVGDFAMLLSNNAATGGTCYGDSGGPNFLGGSNVVAGVTSFGINDCTGVGGVFRLDRSWARDWVASFLVP